MNRKNLAIVYPWIEDSDITIGDYPESKVINELFFTLTVPSSIAKQCPNAEAFRIVEKNFETFDKAITTLLNSTEFSDEVILTKIHKLVNWLFLDAVKLHRGAKLFSIRDALQIVKAWESLGFTSSTAVYDFFVALLEVEYKQPFSWNSFYGSRPSQVYFFAYPKNLPLDLPMAICAAYLREGCMVQFYHTAKNLDNIIEVPFIVSKIKDPGAQIKANTTLDFVPCSDTNKTYIINYLSQKYSVSATDIVVFDLESWQQYLNNLQNATKNTWKP